MEEIIPNMAIDSFGILLGERIGSCCSLSTHNGGNMKARGIAAKTPWKKCTQTEIITHSVHMQ